MAGKCLVRVKRDRELREQREGRHKKTVVGVEEEEEEEEEEGFS
jgi:hypothetical protein